MRIFIACAIAAICVGVALWQSGAPLLPDQGQYREAPEPKRAGAEHVPVRVAVGPPSTDEVAADEPIPVSELPEDVRKGVNDVIRMIVRHSGLPSEAWGDHSQILISPTEASRLVQLYQDIMAKYNEACDGYQNSRIQLTNEAEARGEVEFVKDAQVFLDEAEANNQFDPERDHFAWVIRPGTGKVGVYLRARGTVLELDEWRDYYESYDFAVLTRDWAISFDFAQSKDHKR